MENVDDEIPSPVAVNGSDFHFVFVLDRSGSMQGENIVVARKALQLFVQSLPVGCKFSLISFGSRWELHKSLGGELRSEEGYFNYTDQALEEAVAEIGRFQADFGGTQLDQPIKAARELLDTQKYAKNGRIFVLTDGQVWDRAGVYKQVEDLPPHLRISTFGIGKSFDEELVRRVANKGRGSVSRIYDLDQGSLSAAAVLALKRAMYPSLPDCSITWSGEDTEQLNEVFYNQLVSSFRLFNTSSFESGDVSFTFTCANNSVTGKPIQQTFTKEDFLPVPADSGFVKMAARHLVTTTANATDREQIALKYQVLSPETAFIGVIEEDGKATNKTIDIEIEVKFEKIEIKEEMAMFSPQMIRPSSMMSRPPMMMRRSKRASVSMVRSSNSMRMMKRSRPQIAMASKRIQPMMNTLSVMTQSVVAPAPMAVADRSSVVMELT